MNRQFRAPPPNVLWVSDFTYVASWTDFVYVSKGLGADLSLIVVRTGLPRITPCKPMLPINRCTAQRATSSLRVAIAARPCAQ